MKTRAGAARPRWMEDEITAEACANVGILQSKYARVIDACEGLIGQLNKSGVMARLVQEPDYPLIAKSLSAAVLFKRLARDASDECDAVYAVMDTRIPEGGAT